MFLLSISLVILFALINYPSLMPSPKTEQLGGAYFTRVKYPAIAYQGESTTWSLTICNKNCSASHGGNASFFLMLYVDGDLWWDEYHSTGGKPWPLSIGNSVTRAYGVSSWDTIKPVVHDLKIELYWYDENKSQLQDVVSFPITVAVYVELGNLMVNSYLAVYMIAIFLLGFYMLILGPIEVSSTPEDTTLAFHSQSNRTISILSKVYRQPLFFYVFVFASWQMINALFYVFSITEPLSEFVYLTVQIAYVLLLFLVIRKENSNLREYGYFWPEEAHRYISCSLLLAIVYSLVTIFIPGSFTGYYVSPSPSFALVSSEILLAFVTSLASETIFRGYIQNKLAKTSYFPIALLTTSIMFSLYKSSLLAGNLSYFFLEVSSFFVLGILLGSLFCRTKTLLCPVTFYFTILFFKHLISIKAVTSIYLELFLEVVALASVSLLLSILTVKKGATNAGSSDAWLLET